MFKYPRQVTARGLDAEPFNVRNEHWTREVLTTPCEAGREVGCKVGARPKSVRKCLRDYGERLYDAYWLIEASGGG